MAHGLQIGEKVLLIFPGMDCAPIPVKVVDTMGHKKRCRDVRAGHYYRYGIIKDDGDSIMYCKATELKRISPKICKFCNGSGVVQNDEFDCPVCKGSGEIEYAS